MGKFSWDKIKYFYNFSFANKSEENFCCSRETSSDGPTMMKKEKGAK
jgi:hypothetical protein